MFCFCCLQTFCWPHPHLTSWSELCNLSQFLIKNPSTWHCSTLQRISVTQQRQKSRLNTAECKRLHTLITIWKRQRNWINLTLIMDWHCLYIASTSSTFCIKWAFDFSKLSHFSAQAIGSPLDSILSGKNHGECPKRMSGERCSLCAN